jgi:hypothetical protein
MPAEPFVGLKLGIGDALPAASLAFFRKASSGVPRLAASRLRPALRAHGPQARLAETFAATAGGTFAWRRRHGGARGPAIA